MSRQHPLAKVAHHVRSMIVVIYASHRPFGPANIVIRDVPR